MKIHCIWIWWIWLSALARYYKTRWYEVTWSDLYKSWITEKLASEWLEVLIWEEDRLIKKDLDLVVYSEAIITKPDLSPEEQILAHSEIKKAKELWIKTLSYPEALASVVNSKRLVAISWTHWKSTTTSMLWLVLKESELNASVIVWTNLKEFNNTNFFSKENNPLEPNKTHPQPFPFEKGREYNEIFAIEACEYKRSFLKYTPSISVILNIDLDHLDYFKWGDDYLDAFNDFNKSAREFNILNLDDKLSNALITNSKKQLYIKWNKIYCNNRYLYSKIWENNVDSDDNNEMHELLEFPEIKLKVFWEHMLFDARIVYMICKLLDIPEDTILSGLNKYNWAWRRMEEIKKFDNWNVLASDYWHHPAEIIPTLKALKEKYKNKELVVFFQPHQYSRTIELLEDFKTCFDDSDKLIISDIYFSRDSREDVENMPANKFVDILKENYKNIIFWNWLEKTWNLLKQYSKEKNNSVFLLLWAWDIDTLREILL